MKVKNAKFFLGKAAIPLALSSFGGVAYSAPREPAEKRVTVDSFTQEDSVETENEFELFVELLTKTFRISNTGTVESGSNCGGSDGPCL
jgi:hypothetical protein